MRMSRMEEREHGKQRGFIKVCKCSRKRRLDMLSVSFSPYHLTNSWIMDLACFII